MDNLLVTIGLPVYNAEKFIALTLKSIFNQSYQNYEIIITDDGSDDNTIEVIKSFNDPRIVLISDGINKGISYRLNQQIDLARGKYFFRMDADDIMFPDRLIKQINYLINNSEIDVVGSSVVVINDENEIIAFRKSIKIEDYEKIFKTILFNHPTVAGKISFFRKFRYSENLNGVEDADLWIRSFPYCKFSILEDPILFYRDPLVFKLKTYKFRLDQKNKLYNSNEYLSNKPFLRKKLILLNIFKKNLANFLNLIRMDELLIRRRNNSAYEIKLEWKNVLNNILNEK